MGMARVKTIPAVMRFVNNILMRMVVIPVIESLDVRWQIGRRSAVWLLKLRWVWLLLGNWLAELRILLWHELLLWRVASAISVLVTTGLASATPSSLASVVLLRRVLLLVLKLLLRRGRRLRLLLKMH